MYKHLILELLKKLFDFEDAPSKKLLMACEPPAILSCHRHYIPAFLKFYGQLNGYKSTV